RGKRFRKRGFQSTVGFIVSERADVPVKTAFPVIEITCQDNGLALHDISRQNIFQHRGLSDFFRTVQSEVSAHDDAVKSRLLVSDLCHEHASGFLAVNRDIPVDPFPYGVSTEDGVSLRAMRENRIMSKALVTPGIFAEFFQI